MAGITTTAIAAIHAHARAAYPEECCGILLGRGDQIVDALPAQNLATSNRATRYTLDPRAFLHAENMGRTENLDIVGFYHSHPDHPAIPSVTDAAQAWETYVYLIVSVTGEGPGEMRAWRFTEKGAVEVAVDGEVDRAAAG